MHKLALVALIGLTGSAACIGAAAAIGGRDFADNMDFSMFGDRPRCEVVPGATATSREMDWDGSDHVTLSVGGHATYTPGSDNKVHLSGDPQTLAHMQDAGRQYRDGLQRLASRQRRSDRHPARRSVQEIRHCRPVAIWLCRTSISRCSRSSIAGSGSIKADGKVEHADLHIAGSGDINMAEVATQVSTSISPAAAAPISRPARRPTFTSPARAT